MVVLLHPLVDSLFALTEVIGVCRVNEVVAKVVVGVDKLKGHLFGAFAHHVLLGVAQAHAAQREWADTNRDNGREKAMLAEQTFGRWSCESHLF